VYGVRERSSCSEASQRPEHLPYIASNVEEWARDSGVEVDTERRSVNA
jgi:hypothetical protein